MGGAREPQRAIVLTERGDTVTENVLMAAARHPGTTVIRNASPNYMVQDLCFFLQALGVRIEGIGSTTLTVTGVADIDVDIEYFPSEDPIEAMSLIAAAVVTESTITIERVPIEFLEIELATLEEMGLRVDKTDEYRAKNGHTRLVDLTIHPSALKAPVDKIAPMPFPGLNIDNLPFFALIAACAEGTTMIHDWVYENRAIYLTELTKIGGQVQLLDPHRLMIDRPHAEVASGRGHVPAGAAPGSSSSSRCWPPPARRCCATSTSSTAATRTSPSASTPSARRSRRSATSDPAQGLAGSAEHGLLHPSLVVVAQPRRPRFAAHLLERERVAQRLLERTRRQAGGAAPRRRQGGEPAPLLVVDPQGQ